MHPARRRAIRCARKLLDAAISLGKVNGENERYLKRCFIPAVVDWTAEEILKPSKRRKAVPIPTRPD